MAAKNSRDYWRDREEANRTANIKSEKQYAKEISEIYDYMMDQCQKEINGFYAKYAKKEGITMAEAKKRAAKVDIEEYQRKAKKYVKDKDFSEQANAEMRLYNLTMKVNRLELLKANIGLEMVSGFDELQKYYDEKLTDRTLEEFDRQAGILGKTVQDNAKAARSIVGASFQNATYSERIWMYQSMMKADLGKLLQEGLVQGKSAAELSRHLVKRFGVSKYNAQRLMVTELRRVQTDAAKKSYEANGNEEYEYMATGPNPCAVCQSLNGNVFKVKKMMPGENAPPMHPSCHCSTAPHWDEASYQEWLDTYKEHGLGYQEWLGSKEHIDKMSKRHSYTGNVWPKEGNKISAAQLKTLKKYANDKGVKLVSFDNFDGDTDLIREFIDKIGEVRKDFPKIQKVRLHNEFTLDDIENDFAYTVGNGIHINNYAFRDRKTLFDEYAEKEAEGWFVKGTTADAIAYHEMGHIFINTSMSSSRKILAEVFRTQDDKAILYQTKQALSEYAGTHVNESIAEAFSLKYSGIKNETGLKIFDKCVIMSKRR